MGSYAYWILMTTNEQECLQRSVSTRIHDKIFSVLLSEGMVLHSKKNNPVYHLDRLFNSIDNF